VRSKRPGHGYQKKYGENAEFRVHIDRDNGSYETFRVWTVVDWENAEEWNDEVNLTLEEAANVIPTPRSAA